jgi:hypothetical protein
MALPVFCWAQITRLRGLAQNRTEFSVQKAPQTFVFVRILTYCCCKRPRAKGVASVKAAKTTGWGRGNKTRNQHVIGASRAVIAASVSATGWG